jgi:hypothetical protein
VRIAFPASPGFVAPTGWGAWRKPQPSITFERDSAPDEWAWEAVGLEPEEPARFNWVLMGLILLLTSCPAFALGLLVLLDG